MSEKYALTKWDSWKHEEVPIEGTEDWELVAEAGEGGYDWTKIRIFWSPSARRYFWLSDSGCSCNWWGDRITSATSFEDGDRSAATRALNRFLEGWRGYAGGGQDALREFEETYA